MADPKQDPAPLSPQKGDAGFVGAKAPTTPLTAAQAAKLVSRPPAEPDGKPIPIAAKEVHAFREYDDRVVVVTVDGQKFTANKAAK